MSKRLESVDSLDFQAGQFCYEEPANKEIAPGIMQFVDANPSYVCEPVHTIDETRGVTDDPSADLSNFFSRPVKIFERNWVTTMDEIIYPWELWSSNPRVMNRLTNFRNFRGNLHVKVVINGNSFYWGKALLSYMPLSMTETFQRLVANNNSRMQASQMPHLWIDPTTSEAGTLVLPFFYHKDCLDMVVIDAFRDMGTLWLQSIVPLAHANNLTNPVRITMYAWCEDAKLTTPTHVDIAGLAPQGGRLDFQAGSADEYETSGVISQPAQQFAEAAGQLKDVPVIGPYALAASGMAAGVSSAARSFGYSMPTILEDIRPVKIWQNSQLATTDGGDTCQKLTFTSKQETTVDPRITGLGEVDELAISHLAAREAYINNSTWDLSDPVNTPLWSLPVTPSLRTISTYTIPPSATGMALTPMALAAMPFGFWRGSITFRFQIAASLYHKGRLLIVWDPVIPAATPETNVQYSRIVDIAETRDFSVTVGWGSPYAALFNDKYTMVNNWSSSGLYTPNIDADNGVLTVYVLNSLVTTGANTSPVRVLCSVSSPDLVVHDPVADNVQDFTYHLVPQGAVLSEDQILQFQGGMASDDVATGNAPVGAEKIVQDIGNPVLDKASLFLSGDPITSYRQLLKRYTYSRTLGTEIIQAPGKVSYQSWTETGYPYQRGPAPSFGLDEGGTYNLGPMNVHSLLAGCFYGWSGNIRFKIYPGFASEIDPDILCVARHYKGARVDRLNTTYDDTPDNVRRLMSEADFSWSGLQRTNKVAGNVMEIEIPNYKQIRFFPTFLSNNFQSRSSSIELVAITRYKNSSDNGQYFDLYRSVGEDFQFYFFIAVPTLWDSRLIPVNT
jgi:hypothetical protein